MNQVRVIMAAISKKQAIGEIPASLFSVISGNDGIR
jgi:hypothetical protein